MTLVPHLHRLRSWFLLRPRFWLWIGIIAALLLAVRIALPFVIRDAINKRLAVVEGYSGKVDDIDLQLFRGAYRIDGVSISKRENDRLEPFFAAELVDFSISWGELFHGRLVSDIFLVAPRLQLTKSTTPVDAGEEGRRWQDVIADIFPIEITQLEITRGELSFVDSTSTPRVDISIRDLHVITTGLRNAPTVETGPHPAVLSAEGITIGDGRFKLFAQGDPLADQPTFKLKLDLQDVNLVALNDFLEAYANVDVSAGVFQLYVEVDAAGGAFSGYVKPFIEHVEFKNISDENKGLWRRMWESIVSGVSSIVKNDDRDQVATRVPFSGNFEKTKVGVWSTIVHLVRHGFGQPIPEGRDDEPLPTWDEKQRQAAEAEKQSASDSSKGPKIYRP
ncbi:DUF748 domain-containing protein [Rariglobus hedericola]|uniref:DUF748 domain-containing protein n=1 Tax=Rariglobus hedericola TaxID=2597822 RepID=A0A556QLC6_9BACT|nr:DUF748 domain-containing protein [Rariglobus hedericola]TSJ77428.1 DUF748 domain-containing protein [Rariglobus hedericola]